MTFGRRRSAPVFISDADSKASYAEYFNNVIKNNEKEKENIKEIKSSRQWWLYYLTCFST